MNDIAVEVVKSLLTGGNVTYGISIYHIILLIYVFYKFSISYSKYSSEYPTDWKRRSYIAKYSPYVPVSITVNYSKEFADNPEAFELFKSGIKEGILKGLNKYDDKYTGKRYGFTVPETLKLYKLRLLRQTTLTKKDRETIKKLIKDINKGGGLNA